MAVTTTRGTWGVIYNSVANMRSEPRHSSELVSQALLGTPVRILEKEGEWRRVQTPDKYTGWMNGSIQPVSGQEYDDYLHESKLIVTALYARAMEKPDAHSLPVSDLVMGNTLVVHSAGEQYYAARYPDGRTAYVSKADAVTVDEWLKEIQLTGESVVKSAMRFMGIPYLWGGTSSKGLDCSGFTQQVYFMHGIVLARDASQQVMQGKFVDSVANFGNALPGDLLFFGSKATADNPGEKVVHVGIYMGDKRFIHASDYVRVNSFDPADPLYDEFNANRYLRAKRIINRNHPAR